VKIKFILALFSCKLIEMLIGSVYLISSF